MKNVRAVKHSVLAFFVNPPGEGRTKGGIITLDDDGKDTGFEFNQKAVTLTKTIASGRKAHATWTDYEEKQTGGAANDETGTSYNFGLTVSF